MGKGARLRCLRRAHGITKDDKSGRKAYSEAKKEVNNKGFNSVFGDTAENIEKKHYQEFNDGS